MKTPEQKQMLLALAGLRDQILKELYLNAHFRAFRLADDAWKEHIRINSRAKHADAGREDERERY